MLMVKTAANRLAMKYAQKTNRAQSNMLIEATPERANRMFPERTRMKFETAPPIKAPVTMPRNILYFWLAIAADNSRISLRKRRIHLGFDNHGIGHPWSLE